MSTPVKPLFKYIGGKSWMRETLRHSVAQTLDACLSNQTPLNAYCEPFAGALGAFLSVYDILLQKGVHSVQLQDINPILIQIYQHTQKSPAALTQALENIEIPFNKTLPPLDKSATKEQLKKQLTSAHDFFNQIKAQFNAHKGQTSLEQCARFLFLQTHSFNGVYRENAKGFYNTPFNWSAKSAPSMGQKIAALHDLFSLFSHISFSCQSFENTAFNAQTLYYLDPPYANEEAGENAYHLDRFTMKKQLELIDCITSVPFIYSNHAHPTLLEAFSKVPNLHYQTLQRTNIMSAKAQTRSAPIREILVSQSTPALKTQNP